MTWQEPIRFVVGVVSADTSTMIVWATIALIFCVATMDTRDREERESARERAEMASPDYQAILARRQMERTQRIRTLARRALARQAAQETNAVRDDVPRVSTEGWSRFFYRPIGQEEECQDLEVGGAILQEDAEIRATSMKGKLLDTVLLKDYDRSDSVDSAEIYVEMNEGYQQLATTEKQAANSSRSSFVETRGLTIFSSEIEEGRLIMDDDEGQNVITEYGEYAATNNGIEDCCDKKVSPHCASLAEKVARQSETLKCGDLAQCSICLEEYEPGDAMVQLPCNHVYHDDCVSLWVSTHTRCPLCNFNLVEDEEDEAREDAAESEESQSVAEAADGEESAAVVRIEEV